MPVKFRAVIASNLMTTNGHRYSTDALTEMVRKINTDGAYVAPDSSSPLAIQSIAGKLTRAEIQVGDGLLEVVVDGHTMSTPHGKVLESLLQEIVPHPNDSAVVIVPVGTGNVVDEEVQGYSLEFVAMCPKEQCAMLTARILSVSEGS